MDVVSEAAAYAAVAHAGQTDKAGNPYVFHLYRVASDLQNLGADPEVVAAGFLHDVLEDTFTTADDLLAIGFSERTIAAVRIVTRVDGETYNEFVNRVITSGNSDAVLLKRTDVASNLSLLDNLDDEKKAASLRKRYEKALAALTH